MLKPSLRKLAPIREYGFSLLGGVYLYFVGVYLCFESNRTYLYFGWGILVFCKAFFCLQEGILVFCGVYFCLEEVYL